MSGDRGDAAHDEPGDRTELLTHRISQSPRDTWGVPRREGGEARVEPGREPWHRESRKGSRPWGIAEGSGWAPRIGI
jgi:hypothetical protein